MIKFRVQQRGRPVLPILRQRLLGQHQVGRFRNSQNLWAQSRILCPSQNSEVGPRDHKKRKKRRPRDASGHSKKVPEASSSKPSRMQSTTSSSGLVGVTSRSVVSFLVSGSLHGFLMTCSAQRKKMETRCCGHKQNFKVWIVETQRCQGGPESNKQSRAKSSGHCQMTEA